MQVKTFDEKLVKKLIRESDIMVQQYVKAQKNIIEMQRKSFSELLKKYNFLYLKNEDV